MKTFRLLILILLITFSLGLAQPAHAAPPEIPFLEDDVCFGGTRTLSEGSELNGSLVSFGCNIIVETGATINGDLVAFGGNVKLDGEVTGELVAMGVSVTLNENALILGDLIAPGSSIFRQEGSEIGGQVITESGTTAIEIPDLPSIPEVPSAPEIPSIPDFQPESYFERTTRNAIQGITSAMLRLFQTFALSALAILLVIFVPTQTERVADAMVAQPVATGVIGFLTGVS